MAERPSVKPGDRRRDQGASEGQNEIFFRRKRGSNEALGLMQQPGETFDTFRKRVDAVAEAQGVQVVWIQRVFVHPVHGGEALIGSVHETLDGEIIAFDRDDNRIGAFSSVEAAFAAYQGRAILVRQKRQH